MVRSPTSQAAAVSRTVRPAARDRATASCRLLLSAIVCRLVVKPVVLYNSYALRKEGGTPRPDRPPPSLGGRKRHPGGTQNRSDQDGLRPGHREQHPLVLGNLAPLLGNPDGGDGRDATPPPLSGRG